MKKPSEGDYAPFYAGYIKNITGDVIQALEEQLHSTNSFFKSIPQDKIDFRYAEGKWSIKEVVGHLIDNERVWLTELCLFPEMENNHSPVLMKTII